MLKRIALIYRTLGEAFGARFSPLVSFALFFLIRGSTAVGMALDRVFFPGIQKTQVKSPIVLVGMPRSGTTFLHRWIHEHGLGTGLQVWQMLYPSLTLQKILSPLLPALEKLSPGRHHSAAAHKTGLTFVETDDVSTYLRYVDGLFLYAFVLGWADEEHRDSFDPDLVDNTERDWSWLESLWQRNLYASGGDRVVAKLFTLSANIPKFVARFPDAKILYMLRDPVDVFPSSLSLITGVLDQRFGIWENTTKERRDRYFERIYHGFSEGFRRFHDDYVNGRIPEKNLYIVRYDRMMSEFDTVMAEIFEFIGNDMTPELEAEIRERAEKQRTYKSGHKYDLAKYNLDADQIRSDLAYVYDTFGLPRKS